MQSAHRSRVNPWLNTPQLTKKLAKLLLDEAREAVSVAAVRDFLEKGFQVLADDGVE